MPDKIWLKWDDPSPASKIQWDNNPYTWDEVFILVQVEQALSSGVPGDTLWDSLDEKKKRKLIRLILKVKKETITEEKYASQGINVILKDIRFAIKELLKIEVKVKVKE
jgi:hypothetical protein